MRPADAQLAEALADAARREAEARTAVRDARVRAQDAVREQARILRILKAQGTRLTAAAQWIAKALGLPLTVESRIKIAATLRQRLHRERVTAGHGILAPPALPEAPSALDPAGARMEREHEQEEKTNMGKMIKRTTTTVTEELVRQDEELAAEAEQAEGEDPDADEPEEPDAEPGDEEGEEPEPPRRRSHR